MDNVKSWPELETAIASLSSEQERGEAFEQFCKAFFVLDPVFQFKEVYRQKEIPPSILEQLGYPGRQDIGIDGLAVTVEGKLFAYQAKFRSDRDNTPTLRELSTFFTVSDRADWRITITNANTLPHAINDRTKQSRILADRFDQLDADFFDRLRIYLKEQRVSSPAIKAPHKTQQEAIDAALVHFKDQSRGQLILPCGAGKTLAAMWIAEKSGSSRILVLVPSLSLLSQTLREWAVNTSIKPFRYLCLCSDTTVDLGNDAPIEHRYELDVPVTTDVEKVAEFLANNDSETYVLFSTYQSSKVLSEATLKTGTVFDIAIFDEAHRTTGTDVSGWGLALRDEKIPIKNRIFMTATPRIYAPHITRKAKEEDILICSMDDTTIYGRPIYEMTFGEAIERGHITDYKIVVICVTDSEVREIIQSGGRVITDDEHEWDAKAFAKRVALIKGMKAYGLKKVFTFHARVNGAKAFTDTKTPYGIGQVFKMLENTPNQNSFETVRPEPVEGENDSHDMHLSQGAREHAFISPPLAGGDEGEGVKGKVKFFHVNGTMSSGVRNSIMKEFKEAEIGIMSNARCLTEGVDVPAVDTVAFIDPKKSLIDIVQATGRAMRKAEWKERGYIFIPVVVGEDANPDEIIESSDFATVWEVLQAMVDQDQRLQSVVSKLRVLQGKGEVGTKAWEDTMSEYSEKLEFHNISKKIDKTVFIAKLKTKTIEVVARSWDFWYGLTLRYKEEFGSPNVPSDYKTPEGHSLGYWQTHQRRHYRNGKLRPARIQKLEDVGFIWNPLGDPFEKGYDETLKFKSQFGDANAPKRYKTEDGFNLGNWQILQRQNYKNGSLSNERIQKLQEIGFLWQIRSRKPVKNNVADSFKEQRSTGINSMANKVYRETLLFKAKYGVANAPSEYKTRNGFSLGLMQDGVRHAFKSGALDSQNADILRSIGLNLEETTSISLSEFEQQAFEKGYQETLRYRKEHASSNVAIAYKTIEGYRLGEWQNDIKKAYHNGRLTNERIQKLEDIGFEWHLKIIEPKGTLHEDDFEKGFRETLLYTKYFGDANAPLTYRTQDGYPLGVWQYELKKQRRKGKLTAFRVRRLKGIGLNIDLDSFEEGLCETLIYKDQFGDVNAPLKYKTPEGYKLGEWQNAQIEAYKEGTLVPNKINGLEKIGFIWDLYDAAFEKGIKFSLKYKEQFGDVNTPVKYNTPQGYNLGQWQSAQRLAYKKGKLTQDKINRLEGLKFRWDLHEVAFEKGLLASVKYKKQFGYVNVPVEYKPSDGYNLKQWQNTQRVAYKKGQLSEDRVRQLEEIGFKWVLHWDMDEEVFQKSIKFSLKYKERFGDVNTPITYRTPQGHSLGRWQNAQRAAYKQGRLPADKIKRLEEIGFRWDFKGRGS
ncbi:MAG: Helicase associated domain protein [Deltaproteobacteria bacterium]|nr:Helicase associated domain protein [Deltaproteobacteria bacterium]